MNEREIFETAIEIQNPARRQAYLDQVCGGDTPLRARLNELLVAPEKATQFLNVPPANELRHSAREQVPQMFELPTSSGATVNEVTSAPHSKDEGDELHSTVDLSFLQSPTKPGSIGNLGHYMILKVLGQGAFGIVFKAFDEMLHRHVAIKAMNPQLAATSPPRKRFLREARSVAAIAHENIVQVYSVEEHPLPYLVMEYIDGQTLQQKLDRSGPLDTPEILHLGRQIAAGLAAAHKKGLIHRDIKPGNILLEAGIEQKVKITDFGLARAADDAAMTRTGTIAGTPMFMAPEQALGQTLDHRADLFSLGSVLYQMTSGRAPFRGDNPMAVLKRVIDETPRPIQDILPDVPDWLCAIVVKLQAKNPDDRFQTAEEVAHLLSRCQAELQLRGNLDSLIDILPKLSRRAPAAQKPIENEYPRGEESRAPAWKPLSRNLSNRLRANVWVAFVMFVVGLGMTELTGVTNFRGPVRRLFSPYGTLVVEVDDPELSLSIDDKELDLTGARVKEIQLKPGQYQLLVRNDGRLVRQELVTVTKNGRQPVRLSRDVEPWLDAENAPTLAQRNALEAVISLGGYVEVDTKQDRIVCNADRPLIFEPFKVTNISFQYSKRNSFHEKDFERLRDLPHVEEGLLLQSSMGITPAGVIKLAAIPGLKNIHHVHLQGENVTDEWLKALDSFEGLTVVALTYSRVTGSGLAELGRLRHLHGLDLRNAAVSDDDLKYLKGCTKLEVLSLQDTKVTKSGAEGLAVLLPKCTIYYTDGTIEPKVSEDRDRRDQSVPN